MSSDYVFLCGVMWCKYGQQDAALRTVEDQQLERMTRENPAYALLEDRRSGFCMAALPMLI